MGGREVRKDLNLLAKMSIKSHVTTYKQEIVNFLFRGILPKVLVSLSTNKNRNNVPEY